jgi:hypothetical protein
MKIGSVHSWGDNEGSSSKEYIDLKQYLVDLLSVGYIVSRQQRNDTGLAVCTWCRRYNPNVVKASMGINVIKDFSSAM